MGEKELMGEFRLFNLINSTDGVAQIIEITGSSITTKNKSGATRKMFTNLNDKIEPIALTQEMIQKISVEKVPEWIKYVHEFQNWYFWTHEKKEIKIKF